MRISGEDLLLAKGGRSSIRGEDLLLGGKGGGTLETSFSCGAD